MSNTHFTTAPGTPPAAPCNTLHVTVFRTASRIATLGNLIQDMGLDSLPDDTDDRIEYLSRLDALGVCVHDLAKQIVALVDTCSLEQVKTGTEVAP
jgi:hypothetical protein